ncbi:MAG: ABC transporter ATP-binding protein [Chloroflexi bacterium]|nr:ABC transporter ATP-binding protein [Chloroflexota bacterium]
MTDPIIKTEGLFRTFQMGANKLHALAGIDLVIERNSFCFVMGPSGSGKSTLLHLIGGLDRPSAGRLLVTGTDIAQMDENQLSHYRQKTIGFVFQAFNLVPGLSALENIAFPMRFNGTPVRKRNEIATSLLEKVELEKWAHHRPHELSGGQQQRVALARALVNDPAIILADEPTGNLDSKSGDRIMELLSEFQQSGKTILVVTHDFRLTKYATQVIHLLDGRVVNGEIAAEKQGVVQSTLEEQV